MSDRISFTCSSTTPFTIIHPDNTLTNNGRSCQYLNFDIWKEVEKIRIFSDEYYSNPSCIDMKLYYTIHQIQNEVYK